MTTFYLIRHGKPDYSPCDERGYSGFGRDLASLTKDGIEQAELSSRDERLKDAEIIISSPYTRALQTAAIISKNTGIEIKVEMDLHEWIPDLTYKYTSSEEAFELAKEFTKYRGVYPQNTNMNWESLESLRKRVINVVNKYTNYNKVIIVSHGMALRTITFIEEMKPAEIIECTYKIGQPECEYSFA